MNVDFASTAHRHPTSSLSLSRKITMTVKIASTWWPNPSLIPNFRCPTWCGASYDAYCCTCFNSAVSLNYQNKTENMNLILLSVRMRIHWGTCLFCLAFFAKVLLVRKVLWDACQKSDIHSRSLQTQNRLMNLRYCLWFFSHWRFL